MDEYTAWDNFKNTGSIEAYIRYSQLKNTLQQQEEANANSNGRPDYQGEMRG